jgi:hypothetical protein
MTRSKFVTFGIILAAVATAGVARAESVPAKPAANIEAMRNALAAATRRDPLDLTYSHPGQPAPDGVARTSVERRLSGNSVFGAGFLCGLKPGDESSGARGAYGYDPNGRFVGAKLSFAFH